MKRSIFGLIVAVFFAVVGLVVMQHSSEFSTSMAANNEAEGNTIFDINCASSHTFNTPTNMRIDVSSNGTVAQVGLVTGGINGEIAGDFTAGTANAEINGANIRVWHLGPTLKAYAVCLGGYNSSTTTLMVKNAAVSLLTQVQFNQVAAQGAFSSLGKIMNDSYQVLVNAPTVESDQSTFWYGKQKLVANGYGLGYIYPATADPGETTLTFKSSIDPVP